MIYFCRGLMDRFARCKVDWQSNMRRDNLNNRFLKKTLILITASIYDARHCSITSIVNLYLKFKDL